MAARLTSCSWRARTPGIFFGGMSGYDAKEAGDESPERVAEVQRITWDYLRTALYRIPGM